MIVAVDPEGNDSTSLAERFLSLSTDAVECPVNQDIIGAFSGNLEACITQLENVASSRMTALRKQYERENRRNYEQERQKQELFWAARIAAAGNEAERLHRTLLDQQASSKRNVQRIVPATEGRLRHAMQTRKHFEHEQDSALQRLDQQQALSSTMELVGAAYVAIRPPQKVS